MRLPIQSAGVMRTQLGFVVPTPGYTCNSEDGLCTCRGVSACFQLLLSGHCRPLQLEPAEDWSETNDTWTCQWGGKLPPPQAAASRRLQRALNRIREQVDRMVALVSGG